MMKNNVFKMKINTLNSTNYCPKNGVHFSFKNLFIIIAIAFLSFINCEKDGSPLNEEDKLFDHQKLSLLSLENIGDFWQDDSIQIISSNQNDFKEHQGYLKSIKLSSTKKSIAVSVFQSQNIAIEAMETLQKETANIITGKEHELISGKWWYIYWSSFYAIFINQWNTIIEVSYNHKSDEEVKDYIIKIALEIATRIDKLAQ